MPCMIILQFQFRAMQETYLRYSVLCYTCALGGWYLGTYGVLIPYYSLESGKDETYFSFTFVVRSIAFISSALSIKKLILRFSTHAIINFSLALLAFSLFICSLSINPINLSIMLFLSGFSYILINILTFSMICQLFKGKKPEFWILLLAVAFGAGASLASLLVKWFGLESYKVLAVLYVLPLLFYSQYTIQNIEAQQNSQSQQKIISQKTQLCICFMMLIFPAQETGFVGWIPTYSIKAGVSNVESASIYSLLFWLPNTILRIVWATLPYSVTNKLKSALAGFLFTSFLFLFIQYAEYYELLCVSSSLTFGLLTSSMYGFYITLPLDNGFALTTSNNANFILANCVGEALLTGPIGYSIKVFGFQSLFIIIFIICIINEGAFMLTIKSMSQNPSLNKGKEKVNELQIEMFRNE